MNLEYNGMINKKKILKSFKFIKQMVEYLLYVPDEMSAFWTRVYHPLFVKYHNRDVACHAEA